MLCHCGTALTVSFEERDTKKLHKRQVVTRKYMLERGGKKKKKKTGREVGRRNYKIHVVDK